jgi:hypothetical protein
VTAPPAPVPIWAHAAVAAVAAAVFALLALLFGQDASWDLRNYHWYNPYALLTDRYDMDVAVAQGPSFFNPLPDVPAFWFGTRLSARGAAVALAVLQSLTGPLLYWIGWRTLAIDPPWRRFAIAAALAGAGCGGAVALSEIGTTMQDTLLSVPVLAALALLATRPGVLAAGAGRGWTGAVAAAGVLAGLAMGAKTTLAVMALGLCLAFLAVPGLALRARLARAVLFGIAALAGMAVTGGWWFWHLWRRTGNPLFPFFNDVFRSPLLLADSYKDYKFLPTGLADALLFPLVTLWDPMRVSEVDFLDLRIPLLALVLLASAGFALLGRRRPASASPAVWPAPLRAYLAAFAVVSYVLWLQMFSIYRYVVTLELLAPLLVTGLVLAWPVAPRARAALVTALLLAMVVLTRPADWGRVDWSDRFVPVELPDLLAEATAPGRPTPMLLMGGIEPMGYVVPALPPAMPVVRIQSYLYNPWNGVGFIDLVRQRLAAHAGPLLTLFEAGDHEIVRVLDAYGLRLDDAHCGLVRSPLGPALKLCATLPLAAGQSP